MSIYYFWIRLFILQAIVSEFVSYWENLNLAGDHSVSGSREIIWLSEVFIFVIHKIELLALSFCSRILFYEYKDDL